MIELKVGRKVNAVTTATGTGEDITAECVLAMMSIAKIFSSVTDVSIETAALIVYQGAAKFIHDFDTDEKIEREQHE